MKHIVKDPEPATFSQWKRCNPNATFRGDLGNHADRASVIAKRDLKDSLLNEQHGLCCYCECRVTGNTSHIEHFRPIGIPAFAHLQLEYSNLHASCGLMPGNGDDEHCGHKKSDVFSPNLISPLEPDCHLHCAYRMDGTIWGLDVKGSETIAILHLDSALLNAQRKALIDAFLDYDDDSELDYSIQRHLDPNRAIIGEFYTMVEFLHNRNQL